jgi:hypothetical protein
MMSYIEITLIVGGLAAFFLGWMHHQLKSKALPAVANYTIGSGACLVAFTGGCLWLVQDWRLVAMAWGIWGMAGAVVGLAYFFDGQDSLGRQREIQESLKGK